MYFLMDENEHKDLLTSFKIFGLNDEEMDIALKYCISITNRSNSTLFQISNHIFMTYDYPPAEDWARNCHWKPLIHMIRYAPFTLFEFNDIMGSVEFKIRWYR